MKGKQLIYVALVLVVLSSSTIFAHRGTNISYDEKKSMTSEGTVTSQRPDQVLASPYLDKSTDPLTTYLIRRPLRCRH
jgi:hypothetical protein